MSGQVSFSALINGRVQGVFFRSFTQGKAHSLGLCGYVRNLASGAVEVYAEGNKAKLEILLSYLELGPIGSTVSNVKVDWSVPSGQYKDFSIR
jgi:acylphosphatase